MAVNIAQAGGNIKKDVKGKTTDATSGLGPRFQGVQGSRENWNDAVLSAHL